MVDRYFGVTLGTTADLNNDSTASSTASHNSKINLTTVMHFCCALSCESFDFPLTANGQGIVYDSLRQHFIKDKAKRLQYFNSVMTNLHYIILIRKTNKSLKPSRKYASWRGSR